MGAATPDSAPLMSPPRLVTLPSCTLSPLLQVTAKNYMEAFEKAVHDKDWPFE